MSLSFGHPWVLSLLAVPLLLLALVWSGRGGRLPLPFDGTARPDRRSRGVGLSVLLRLDQSFQDFEFLREWWVRQQEPWFAFVAWPLFDNVEEIIWRFEDVEPQGLHCFR